MAFGSGRKESLDKILSHKTPLKWFGDGEKVTKEDADG